MHYAAFATDYDGTIAHDGVVDPPTIAALERLRASGRRLILVTGRELNDLFRVLPQIDLFDRVVAENGAVLYRPDTKAERNLAEPPPPRFAQRLREAGVDPLSVGRVIVATWQPNEGLVLDAIRELGLGLQIIFNKGAVMVLPAGVNKESGLRAALDDLGISPLGCVAVGDAENDFAFLDLCGAPVAVANALESLKQNAVLVTNGARGAGVTELIDHLLADDFAALDRNNPRQHVHLAEGLAIAPHRERMLLAGASGGGKSTLTLGLLERMTAAGLQVCVLDPEGDYDELERMLAIGTAKEAPRPEAVADLLRKSDVGVAVNLMGLKVHDRPAYFAQLLSDLVALRAEVGRPHVIIVDEAHHVLPVDGEQAGCPAVERGMMFVTVHRESLAACVPAAVDRMIVVGDEAAGAIDGFCKARAIPAPEPERRPLETGEMLTCAVGDPVVRRCNVIAGEGAKRRHVRKYAEGRLGDDKSFYFRGPDAHLNLRARNLLDFLDLEDGVDNDTWHFHRQQGDYSRWISIAIKDEDLAAEVGEVERGAEKIVEAKLAIRAAIEKRYTLPA